MVTEALPRPLAQRTTWRRLLGRDFGLGWLLLLPVAAVLAGLVAYPFILAIVLSFTDKMIGRPAHFVGLQNYRDILTSAEFGPIFRTAVRNTVVYTVVAVACKSVLGMGMALFLNEPFRGRNLMRAICFLPWAIPSLIVGLSWQWIYNGTNAGVLNMLLNDLHLSDTLIQWLGNPHLALWSVILVVIWQGCPFYGMMFLAGLQAIPAELYEAAAIDGAGVFGRYRYVTLPGLRGVMTITILLSTIWTANSFNYIYVLTGGGPANSTMTFPMFAYQVGIAGAQRLGAASAITILFLPLFLLIIFALSRRMLTEEV
jgi:multiple sugar transport system permease protein